MTAVRHLGFVIGVRVMSDDPWRLLGGLESFSLCIFRNRFSSFNNRPTQVLVFCEFGLKTFIHALWEVLRVLMI